MLFADRVEETTPTTGTVVSIDLGGATAGAQGWVAAGLNDGEKKPYTIVDGVDFEIGVGTATAGAPDTFSRDEVHASTNGGNRISLSGTARIFNANTARALNEQLPVARVQTTDATPTAIHSITLADNHRYSIEATVTARRTDMTGGAFLRAQCSAYREGGGAVIDGGVLTPVVLPSSTPYLATLVVSGNDVQVQFTGAAGHTVEAAVSNLEVTRLT